MGVWLESLGGIVRDASLAAFGLLSLSALAMLSCRQPVRRICLARAAIVGSLLLIPLVGFAPLPRLELLGILRSPTVQSHPYFDESGAAWRGGTTGLEAGPPSTA